MNKLIILDRDGVINEDSDHYIKSLEEWIPLPGSIEAIARLSKAGFTIAIATNQSGLARGYFTEATLEEMHARLSSLLEAEGGRVDCLKYCPHGPDDGCHCRKPKTGLIEQIEQDLNQSAKDAWMIGDSLRDIQSGQSAGCKTALVRTGKGERTLSKGEGLEGVPVFDNLAAFADFLLADNNTTERS